MKLKYYLRGIGIGLIITTIVMALAFMLHKDELISDEEVRRRAEAIGMVMPEETGGRDTLLNNDSASPEALNVPQSEGNVRGSDETDAAQSVSAQQDAEKKQDNKSDSNADDNRKNDQKEEDQKKDDDQKEDQETNDDQPEQGEDEAVELSIVGGEYSDIVSQKLYKAGLIEDADEFNKYLAEGGFDNLIQPGTYLIPVGSDYKTIVSIITEKK